jgi:hypothetical protein
VKENAMDLAEASTILWRQRQLLELLLYRLDVEQALIAVGRTRWLSRATDDVEHALDELRLAELARAVAIDEVASQLGLPPGCTLRELAAAAPAPYDALLLDHREALLRLTGEVDLVARANRDLLRRTHHAMVDVLGVAATDHPFELQRSGDHLAQPLVVDRVI